MTIFDADLESNTLLHTLGYRRKVLKALQDECDILQFRPRFAYPYFNRDLGDPNPACFISLRMRCRRRRKPTRILFVFGKCR